MFDAMAKHGLTEKALRSAKLGKTAKEQKAAGKALLAPVKDAEAFLIDLLTQADKLNPRRRARGTRAS